MGVVIPDTVPLQDQYLWRLMRDIKMTRHLPGKMRMANQVKEIKIRLLTGLIPMLLEPPHHHTAESATGRMLEYHSGSHRSLLKDLQLLNLLQRYPGKRVGRTFISCRRGFQ
jgi:hypothetical protein